METTARATLMTLALTILAGCPKSEPALRIGADQTLEALGIAEYLRAAYEGAEEKRVELVHLDTTALHASAMKGDIDVALVVSERTREALEAEGIPKRSDVYAHEELVFIGPFENYLGDHIDGADGVGVVQAIARSNYRYLMGAPGSAERARHDLLFDESGDRIEPGSFFETKLEGLELVEQAVETNSFALVKRSALLLAAERGTRPHRVYREGDPQLVLRLAVVEVHPGKTGRPVDPGFYDFLMGEQGQAVLEGFGAARFGYPVYGKKAPPEGEGARVPGVDRGGAKR